MSKHKPYQPSNGTEGCMFTSYYCDNCTRDRNQECMIVAYTMAFNIDDKEYPKEWCYDKDGNPTCTKFKDNRIKHPRLYKSGKPKPPKLIKNQEVLFT